MNLCGAKFVYITPTICHCESVQIYMMCKVPGNIELEFVLFSGDPQAPDQEPFC